MNLSNFSINKRVGFADFAVSQEGFFAFVVRSTNLTVLSQVKVESVSLRMSSRRQFPARCRSWRGRLDTPDLLGNRTQLPEMLLGQHFGLDTEDLAVLGLEIQNTRGLVSVMNGLLQRRLFVIRRVHFLVGRGIRGFGVSFRDLDAQGLLLNF